MDWLLHNPIADMYGPYFLLLYGGVIVALVVEAAWSKRRNDPTVDLEPPPVPSKPNPHEIAFLRGGAAELTRLLVFDLMRRGYLRLQSPEAKRKSGQTQGERIEQAPDHPSTKVLSDLEERVFQHFMIPHAPGELFHLGCLVSGIEESCGPIERALQEEQLLSPPVRYAAAARVGFSGAFLILALGGYKLAVALEKGHRNVMFLIMMGIAGLGALAIIAVVVPRLTHRGKEYLRQLQQAFGGLKDRAAVEAEEGAMAGADPALFLVAALFGVAALAGTPFGYVSNLFKSTSNTGSDGGGCGGGGCGGGGCGGGGCGGGGCGGGGCGGCGS